jgi:HSP20 family protein
MANLNIHKTGGPLASSIVPPEWDPFRRLREFMLWEPYQELVRPTWEGALTLAPAFEVKETKDSYIFKADVPGMKEQDIDITLTGNRLMVSGKREMEQQESGTTFFTYERAYGSFNRTFTLPEGANAEHVKAELKDGVLTVVFPKVPEVQAKKIAIKASEKVRA